ncbi:DEAD/DEAH box helicase [Nocardioides bruguierae]|uniref:DEAD/DEAH box helicase n=1 Tax=Nocardioides bruguierae TaxID=2945102 RepID=A0A9X2D917_9ACTN|nr:DEAD/DEAH box helicase [Nocardioides bruguierae]MCM0621047.1 DEAD/DEAH box helicase [Nocardioides bruguierae]
MSFVPVTGTATFHAARPPRESVVEFTDERRTVALPMRAALPILTKAHGRTDLDPSTRLLSGAALLGMRLVAAGTFEPAPAEEGQAPSWQVGTLEDADEDRVRMLAAARAHDALDEDEAESVVRAVLDAVVDAMPRGAPRPGQGARGATRPATARPRRRLLTEPPGPGQPTLPEGSDDPPAEDRFRRRLADRIARHRHAGVLPTLVTLSLRVEADEEDLTAGSVRVVPQVAEEREPLHLVDAAALWVDDPTEHGFGDRARVHAAAALRGAAEAWPVLERLLDQRVPDEILLEADELADLLESGVAALAGRGVDVLWPRSLGRDLSTSLVLDEKKQPRAAKDAPLQTGLLTPDAVFAFSWQVALGEDPLTEEEMEELARAASPVVRLRGAWTVVDPSVARKARKRLVRTVRPPEAIAAALTGGAALLDGLVLDGVAAQLEAEARDPGPPGTAGHDEWGAGPSVVLGASLLKVRERLAAVGDAAPVAEPAGLEATLRDYQRAGLTWLSHLTGMGLGACLADDMGLGKTITLIALHLHRAEQARAAGTAPAPTLVVCPTSLLGNWEAEIRRFAPGVPVRRFHGAQRSLDGLAPGEATLLDVAGTDSGTDSGADPGFVLTTYGTMRTDTVPSRRRPAGAGAEPAAESAEEPVVGAGAEQPTTGGALGSVPWGLVVADEAQHVKNARSATARGLRTLGAQARVALTGTPVENDLTELWSILDWLVPGLLGSRQAFRRVWAAPIETGEEPTKAAQFADLVRPFLLRRRKSDPGIAPELPPKTETDHLLSLSREQAVLYESFVRETMERIEAADEDSRRGLVLALLTGCKQICNHPAQFLRRTGTRSSGRSPKIELLDELLGTVLAEDGAVLVFTQYVAMARIIEGHLARAGVPHQLLHGGTPVKEREAMVRRFQDDGPDRVPVFLLSLKAGGTGLNLTRADHVVHVDRWWNPAVEEQATDRAYRIGQTKPVQVHRMVTRGTVEEKVAELLTRKRALADAVLGGGEAALTELSNDELRDLVSLR